MATDEATVDVTLVRREGEAISLRDWFAGQAL
jgi:hypothetical protein